MKLLSLLSSTFFLLLLQQAVSLWFLFDFFFARDSATFDTIWRPDGSQGTLHKNISHLTDTAIGKHCGDAVSKEPMFDKVVLVIIDALGSEFLPSIQTTQPRNKNVPLRMPFLENRIKRNEALGFIAKAATPTVTMPRVKALLSGTIPSFIDIVYNLASDVRRFDDDNIISIAKSNNKTLVFYGDDTWLSLFEQNIFTRSRVTLSFFATDYTTVDTNVTEMALPETSKESIDWDYLILHYLGLDHLGHLMRSNNIPLIDEKLLELDSVLEKIYENMAARDHKTLVIVCGDHGMNREGNHGGESDLEANTAMVFLPINQKLSQIQLPTNHIQQIDFSVTLSLLTNFDIPRMSRGVAIIPLLQSLWANDPTMLTCSLLNNVIQLSKLSYESIPEIDDRLTKLLLDHIHSNENKLKFAQRYFEIAQVIQSNLNQTIVSRNNPILLTMGVTIAIILTLLSLRRTSLRMLLPMTSKQERMIGLLIIALPIIMQGSTDFLEYEHKFWPIFSMVSLVLLIVLIKRSSIAKANGLSRLRTTAFFATFVITTVCQNLNLFRDSYILPAISLLFMCNFLYKNGSFQRKLNLISSIIIYMGIAICKFEEEKELQADLGSGIDSAIDRAVVQRIASLVTALYTLANVIQSKKEIGETDLSALIQKLASGWMLTALLLARSGNFLFLVSNVLMEASLNSILNSLDLSSASRVLVYANFAQSAFFSQGNTNLFSSIDVKPAFYGQTSYSLSLSIPIVAISTFSAQIYWLLKLLQRMEGVKLRYPHQLKLVSEAQPVRRVRACAIVSDLVNNRNFLSLGFLIYVCMILRNHVFVWSVLSPKLIYHYFSNLVILFALVLISNLHRLQGHPSSNVGKSTIV